MVHDLVRAGILGLIVLATPASADRLKLTVDGTVGDVTGDGSLLGTPASGDGYRLVYLVDFSRGVYGGGQGGFGGSVYILGGTSLDPFGHPPGIIQSPISALLSIGTSDVSFAGVELGSMEYIHDSFGVMFGNNGFSLADLIAQDAGDRIETIIAVDDFRVFNGDLRQPMRVAVDGTHVTGSSSFNVTSGSATVSGTLRPGSYTVTAVPEPATWSLMLAGFGVVGAACRRRTRRDNASLDSKVSRRQ